MKLMKMSDRIWYSESEEKRDRPSLGYVRGDHWSVAIDAGHSDAHVREFYEALEKENLPLPSLTVITHWHWDHSFGMHSINGLSIAGIRTNEYLEKAAARIAEEGPEAFLSLDPSVQMEYEGNRAMIIVPTDILYDGRMSLNAGNVHLNLFESISPHTDDTTLVYVPEERFLFVGDAISGVFPTWERDPEKTRQLIRVIEETDAEYCLGGHWPVMKKPELIQALKQEMV